MPEEIGSVRRSLVFGGFETQMDSAWKMPKESSPRTIRWKKGEVIGCGAYGRVYMGMNLDSGELLAIKQVLIAANNLSKDKAQAHIQELEEEVKLLRNLSHPNIVRYLGTAREDEALNILLEFVPGGSIASLLGKFGSFTEPVIRMYTKQLLQGLEYLHQNNIMHRDIKGANILVDNKGCIKLADFGASKKVVELATMTGAKSMKGTPYWMAPEVIRQTGHGLSADIWSVGCTVIEMATGKPPWSQQFQEVAALFHIGTTKSHPPIPEHLSPAAKDFLLKCLEKEPNLRPTATELLQHPFVIGEYRDVHPLARSSILERSLNSLRQSVANIRDSCITSTRLSAMRSMQDMPNLGSVRCSTLQGVFPESQANSKADWESNMSNTIWSNFDAEDLNCSVRLDSVRTNCFTKSFNPMCEPSDMEDERGYKLNESRIFRASQGIDTDTMEPSSHHHSPEEAANDFSFQCGHPQYDDDDEVTESKIRAFLDEKALELKRLQTPLYEEFYSTINAAPNPENAADSSVTAPMPSSRPSLGMSTRDSEGSVSSGSPARGGSTSVDCTPLAEVTSPRLNQLRGLLQETQQASASPSLSCFERHRIWKEELDQELERKREELRKRLAAKGGKTASPKDKSVQRHRSPYATTPTK
eukprot:Gb_36743 [translate_table: standard]